MSLMDPDPAAEQVAPDVATQDHVAPLSDAGSGSDTEVPITFEGPALPTTIVYVRVFPAIAVVDPSVLVIVRLASGSNVSVSVAVLLVETGSTVPDGTAIDAEFTMEPVALGETLAVTVYVAVEPTAMVTVSLMSPVPLAAHDAPAVATHVHEAPVSVLGTLSVIDAPTTFDGPLFEATMVYARLVPGTALVRPSVFVIARSERGVSVSTSEPVLSPGVESVVPTGVEIVAVLVNVPVALRATVAVRV